MPEQPLFTFNVVETKRIPFEQYIAMERKPEYILNDVIDMLQNAGARVINDGDRTEIYIDLGIEDWPLHVGYWMIFDLDGRASYPMEPDEFHERFRIVS